MRSDAFSSSWLILSRTTFSRVLLGKESLIHFGFPSLASRILHDVIKFVIIRWKIMNASLFDLQRPNLGILSNQACIASRCVLFNNVDQRSSQTCLKSCCSLLWGSIEVRPKCIRSEDMRLRMLHLVAQSMRLMMTSLHQKSSNYLRSLFSCDTSKFASVSW